MSKIIEKILSIKNSKDKSHKVCTVLGVKVKFKKKYRKSYALNSGERQTGKTIQEIRADHVNRYELAAKIIKREQMSISNLKGMDVFCGNGYGSFLIEQETGAEMTSIDGSKDAVNFAKKYYGNTNITYSHKLFPFKIKKNYYDFIVSLESIEHVKDDKLFLSTLYESLMGGSVLIISTPNSEKNDLTINKNHFHYRHYTNAEFIQFSKTIGFELLEMYGQDVYSVNQYGGMTGVLAPEEMNIKKDYNGQFTIFVLKKQAEMSAKS